MTNVHIPNYTLYPYHLETYKDTKKVKILSFSCYQNFKSNKCILNTKAY